MSSMAPTSVSQRLVWLQSPGVLILALVLGVLFGIFAPHRMLALDVLADVYLNLLQILVVPLILCSIILNIQGMFKERTYTRTSLRAMSGLFLMALLPALLGMVVAQLLNPGAGITTENLWRIEKVLGGQNIDQVSRINLFSDAMDTQSSAIDGLINAFLPNNIFLALAQGDEIKIAVFAIMFGFAVSVINSRLKDDFNQSLEAVISACFKISHLCSFALPLVIFIVASQICSQVGSDALVVMAHFLITFLTVTFLLCLISFVILKFRSDASGFGVLSSLLPTLRISLASGEHSSVCIPQMIDTLSARLGFSQEKVAFLVPLATVFVRSAPIMYFAVATVFVAQIYGHPITHTEWLLILGLSVAQGFASVGLQGANKLALLAVICNPLGLPTEAIILLLLAIEPICAFLSGLTMTMSQCAYVAIISNKPVRL